MSITTTSSSSTPARHYDADTPNTRLQAGLADIAEGLGRWKLWTALAWQDIQSTYRRSLFGVLWITLSFSAFVMVKLFIFIPIMRSVNSETYAIYLTLGFFIWQFLSNIVSTAPQVFTSSEAWIKNDPLPLSTYVFQSITRAAYNLFFTSLVVVALFLFLEGNLRPVALTSLLAIALMFVNAVWVKLLLGVICTRFRDLTHLVQTIMRVMFFLTPIFWLPEQMGGLMKILWWNPFAHFIWIFRTPILDGVIPWESWAFTGAVTLLGWSITIPVFAHLRRRIVFWF